MRFNKFYSALAISAAVSIIAVWALRTDARSDGKSIQLALRTTSETYTLGEMVDVGFELKNTSGVALDMEMPNVYKGNVRLFVSADGATFSEYVGPNWARVSTSTNSKKVAAGESLESAASMLFNRRYNTGHLSPLYADRSRKGRIGTDFAIMEPGAYWLKAIYSHGDAKTESEPLLIHVLEPQGEDAAVWERIKLNGAYAYFLQTGDVKYHPASPQADEFIELVRDIVEEFPASETTERFQQNLAKRSEMLLNLERIRQLQ